MIVKLRLYFLIELVCWQENDSYGSCINQNFKDWKELVIDTVNRQERRFMRLRSIELGFFEKWLCNKCERCAFATLIVTKNAQRQRWWEREKSKPFFHSFVEEFKKEAASFSKTFNSASACQKDNSEKQKVLFMRLWKTFSMIILDRKFCRVSFRLWKQIVLVEHFVRRKNVKLLWTDQHTWRTLQRES